MKGNVHLRTVLGGTKDTVSDSLFAAASGSSDGQDLFCEAGHPGSIPGSFLFLLRLRECSWINSSAYLHEYTFALSV